MRENKALTIKGLHYSVDGTEILKGIDLEVNKGEFVGFIGPNGAGKTTLLKCISGILRSAGSVAVNGKDIKSLKSKDAAKEIVLMHQNTSITFPFPSADVVLMGRYAHLKRLQGESSEDYAIARKYMEYTDTAIFERTPITQVSGGERQRVLFAKVLTQQTDMVLLDEPTASLDISHQEQIFRYSQDLCSSGKTVIAAIHDLKIASRYCSRLVLMKEGRIIADGLPEEVLTSENLSKAYGVNALVYKNRITGLLDFYMHGMKHTGAEGKHIHVIGGGGSASGVIRQLFEEGCKVTAGVFAHGDSDLLCAEIYGIEHLASEPFTEIADELLEKNIKYIMKADITILCNMPFGVLNFKNLKAAKHSSRLVIIEDEPPEVRDFTGGKAKILYYELKENAVVITSAALHEVL